MEQLVGDVGLTHLLLEQMEQLVGDAGLAHLLLEQMEQLVVMLGWLTCCVSRWSSWW